MTYRKCQRQLLKAEIDSKESRLKVLRNKFNHVKCELQIILNFIDFAHICSLFLISNDRSLEKRDKIQQKKFSELLKEYPPRNDPEKVLFNFSKATLNESEKVLSLCLLNNLNMRIIYWILNCFLEIFVN